MNGKMHFKSTLQHALQQRAACTLNALCLVNGSCENLPDLVIHEYSQHVFIQTTSLERDKQIAAIIEILQATRQPKSIWLKNQSEARQKRHLPLVDQLLWGEDAKMIAIREAELSYNYSTDAKELWPLQDRRWRQSLTQWQKQNPQKQFLHIAVPTPFGLNTLFEHCSSVAFQAPQWSDVCDVLRKLTPDEWYRLGVICLPPVFANEKNKKAIFHVVYQFLNVLHPSADAWLSLFASDTWVLGLLQKAALAQKKNLFLIEQHCGEADFPLLLSQKNKWLPVHYKFVLSQPKHHQSPMVDRSQ